MTQATAAFHQAVAIQHCMDRTFGRDRHSGEPPDQTLPDFTSTPAAVLALDVQNVVFNLKRKLTAKAIGSATPIRQSLDPAFLIAIKDLVAGFAGNPKLPAEFRHRVAMCSVRSVTHVSGRSVSICCREVSGSPDFARRCAALRTSGCEK